MAFTTWWLAALAVSALLPAMSANMPISPLWLANSLAYGTILAIGLKPVPYFAAAALSWNLARGDAPLDIVVGTGTFLLLMLFVAGFSRWLERHVERDQARRLLRVPIIAILSASLFTLLGVWQFASGLPAPELAIGLWLSEATSVLLFTPLARQWLLHGIRSWVPPSGESRSLRPLLAWCLLAIVVLVAIAEIPALPRAFSDWLLYLGLVLPILAVYLLPVGLPRLVVPLFVLAWTTVHLELFTDAKGVLDETAMLQGQMVLFTAALIGFLSIEAVHSYHRANRRLEQASRRDGLTGLYNDLGMTERLAHKATDERYALIGIQVPDIDDLATLTGLDEVHALERDIADTLRATVPVRQGLGARLQPGLFALLVPHGEARAELIEALRQAFQRSERGGSLANARLGLRMALVERVENADARHLTSILLMACTRAGQQENERFYRHHGAPDHLIEAHRETLRWAGRLRDALAGDTRNGGFELFVQPILDRQQPKLARAEVLLRWRQPNGELLGAGAFLPVAENFGLMPRVDAWVVSNALAEVSTHPGGERLTELAINLSGDSLASAGLVSALSQYLTQYGWPAERLCLEITESMVIHDVQVARENVRALHALGARLAIDDFGTGQASFAYLQDYPVQELKIDGRFIQHIATPGFDREVVRATCAIAEYLGARVVAEFVETPVQVEALYQLGVHCLQGFGIAHPIPLMAYLEGVQAGLTMVESAATRLQRAE
ncbi:EAL domain-containing protein [Billgrantia gudaonensis]|uniref:EAL domain-containing protein n=1 Tax=Billgrantia gudaonensis TaxID=376427 RepID=UPI0015A31F25|nr:EAL domain-containing protein [Halomonas gudaonensis]